MIEGCDLNNKGRKDEAFLLRFLRAKKFDVDKAFKMMSKYYYMKKNSSELFHVSPVSDLKVMLEMQIQCMLPQKDIHGRQVYVFRVGMCSILLQQIVDNTIALSDYREVWSPQSTGRSCFSK